MPQAAEEWFLSQRQQQVLNEQLRQHSTTQHNTEQHSTAQHSTAQHSTSSVQHSRSPVEVVAQQATNGGAYRLHQCTGQRDEAQLAGGSVEGAPNVLQGQAGQYRGGGTGAAAEGWLLLQGRPLKMKGSSKLSLDSPPSARGCLQSHAGGTLVTRRPALACPALHYHPPHLVQRGQGLLVAALQYACNVNQHSGAGPLVVQCAPLAVLILEHPPGTPLDGGQPPVVAAAAAVTTAGAAGKMQGGVPEGRGQRQAAGPARSAGLGSACSWRQKQRFLQTQAFPLPWLPLFPRRHAGPDSVTRGEANRGEEGRKSGVEAAEETSPALQSHASPLPWCPVRSPACHSLSLSLSLRPPRLAALKIT